MPRRAGDVIQGIHHFVRKSEGERRAVDMNETIREVLRLLHSDLLGRSASIETRLASNSSAAQSRSGVNCSRFS